MSGTRELPAGQGYVNRSGYLGVGARGGRRLGESTVQLAGRPLMACARRPADGKNPTFADLKAGMITGIRQCPGIIGCP
jgi:hypothetical protein